MTKTAKTQMTDPFAAVRKVMIETVDAMTENQEKAQTLAQAEITKAKHTATEQAGKAQAAVKATIAAGEVVVAGAEKAGILVFDEVNALTENRVAAAKQMIGAATIADAINIQTALFKAEQKKAQAFAKSFTELAQAVANDALKPIQAQVTENLKSFNVKAA